MQITYYGKNLTVTDDLKAAVEKKLDMLSKYFSRTEPVVKVTFSVIRDTKKVEITVVYKTRMFRVEEASDDFYKSIAKASEVLERKIRKRKDKVIDGYHKKESIRGNVVVEEEYEEPKYEVIRHKKFEAIPYHIEEAIDEMERLGHVFFIFMNIETGGPSLVYKREYDEAYGLIDLV